MDRHGIVLQVNDRVRVDAKLEVGTVTESTTVMAESPLVRTDSSEVGTVIEERAIKELPLNGRNFATLVYLVPGDHAGPGGREPLRRQHLQPARRVELQRARPAGQHQRLARRRHRQQRVHVQHRHRRALGRVGARVQGADRACSRPSSAAAPASSRCRRSRARNEFHGTVFEYLRNDAFDARNFFVRKVPRADGTLPKDPKPPLDRHQFGGAVGGALVIPGLYDGHNRTFFFADYSGIKEKRGADVRQHRADRGDAQRRLQRLPRPRTAT